MFSTTFGLPGCLCGSTFVRSTLEFLFFKFLEILRILKLLKDGSIVKTYNIDLGFEPIGHKQKRGDGKTPEGLYYINKKLFDSDFHIALQISYPNKWDLRKSKINRTYPGGSIMIHGKPNDKDLVERSDWTNGCIAVTNSQIEEINKMVKLKTPIYIKK